MLTETKPGLSEREERALRERYEHIVLRKNQAAIRCGRDPGSIRIVAVSKTKPIDYIVSALRIGIRDFGENYVQELREKAAALNSAGMDGPQPEWHVIGHLQRNKVKYLVEDAALIHSVDSVRLAREISRQALQHNRNIDILLQVNTSGEESKFGVSPEMLPQLARETAVLPGITIRGLMTIAVFSHDPELTRPMFRRLRSLRDELRMTLNGGHPLDDLSMGMTGDFETAIEEGATIVRIGTAIFGERTKK